MYKYHHTAETSSTLLTLLATYNVYGIGQAGFGISQSPTAGSQYGDSLRVAAAHVFSKGTRARACACAYLSNAQIATTIGKTGGIKGRKARDQRPAPEQGT